MPIGIDNITDEAHQRHTIIFEESEVVISLRFHPTVGMWTIDIEYKESMLFGYKLSVDVLHIRSRNMPFDFTVVDDSGAGLDPFKIDDFSTDRCSLYMLQSDDMELIRGAPVPL